MTVDAARDLEQLAEHLRGRYEVWAASVAAGVDIFLSANATVVWSEGDTAGTNEEHWLG